MTKAYAYLLGAVNIAIIISVITTLKIGEGYDLMAARAGITYGPDEAQRLNAAISRQPDFDHLKNYSAALCKWLDDEERVSLEWKNKVKLYIRA